jgi:hypothetical protein
VPLACKPSSFTLTDHPRLFATQPQQRHLPGAISEGVVSALPLTGEVGWGQINVQGFTPAPGQELQVDLRTAPSDYFRTMKIPLRKGRFFSDHDTLGMQPVAIVDDRFAQRFWAHDNPMGNAATLSGAVVREIHAVDSSVAVYQIRTMQDRLYDSLARQRVPPQCWVHLLCLA